MPMTSDDIHQDDWPGCPRDDCYFCRDDCHVLEEHHIVPERHGGSDADRNKVALCPTCHAKLERLYDRRFYQSLGIGDPGEVVQHISDYVVCELERIDLAISRAMGETRDRIGATQLHDDGVPDDLRQNIDEALSEYSPEATGRTGERADQFLELLTLAATHGYLSHGTHHRVLQTHAGDVLAVHMPSAHPAVKRYVRESNLEATHTVHPRTDYLRSFREKAEERGSYVVAVNKRTRKFENGARCVHFDHTALSDALGDGFTIEPFREGGGTKSTPDG